LNEPENEDAAAASRQPADAPGQPAWRATVITLFPELFPGPLGASVIGKALERAQWSLETVQLRDFGLGPHAAVDDRPFGGGAGMVMRPDVLAAAMDAVLAREAGGEQTTGRSAARSINFAGTVEPSATSGALKEGAQYETRPLIYLSPRGTPLRQSRVRELSRGPGVILLAGRFEGVDQRILEARDVEEISIGDYVLSGGEIAAYALIDACVRLRPGVLGTCESLEAESFEDGLLEYPQYTRPRTFEGRDVPEVLVSGDHEKIARWRREKALELTRTRRPDLLIDPKRN